MRLNNAENSVGATHSLKLLTSPRRVTTSKQLDLLSIANLPALDSLKSVCKKEALLDAMGEIFYHQMMAVYSSRALNIEHGNYHLASIIAGDESIGAVTLAKPLQMGDWASSAVRDMDAAQIDLVKTAGKLRRQLDTQTNNNVPQFGLLFSCLGRGLYLYNGVDQDLALLK